MKAWTGAAADGCTTYRLIDLPEPSPGAGELLVRVRAVGLNRVDQQPKSGHFRHSTALTVPIPGLEVAGEVVALGEGADGHAVGDRVTGMVQGGCAEYACLHATLAIRMPPSLGWTDAAALPVSYLTAHDALVTNGRLTPGGSVLIHAVSSGVGIAALQLARLRGAAFIAGSSGSRDKLDRLAPLGLTLGLLGPPPAFAETVLRATGSRGVNVVVDNVGGPLLNETVRATALGGRVIDVGRLGGVDATIDLNLLAVRRVALIGVTFRTRSLAEHAAVVTAFLADHAADFVAGRLAPVVDRVFPFDRLPDAIARGQRREQLGKLVLEL
jgi:NADPH:quinone reductase-like Zn-dependent oxidoreductase